MTVVSAAAFLTATLVLLAAAGPASGQTPAADAGAAARAEALRRIEAQIDECQARQQKLTAETGAVRQALAQAQDPKQKAEFAQMLQARARQQADGRAELDALIAKAAAMRAQEGTVTPSRPVDPAAPPGNPPPGGRRLAAGSVNPLAFDLYARLKDQPGNLCFSPLSIDTALAMTLAAARGKTADEMAAVLHLPAPARAQPQPIAAEYSSLLKDLRSGGKGGPELVVANSLWGQKDYGFLSDFTALLKNNYGADLSEVDFRGDAEGARRAINTWVEKETRDRIRNLIPPETLALQTRLVLVNAIYLKAAWQHQFRKGATAPGVFQVTPAKQVAVPLMDQMEEFGYGEAADVQLLAMPYAGSDLQMLVILPKKTDGLPEVEKTLSAEKLGQWLPNLRRREVRVTLPKFKTTTGFMLRPTLAAMGMPLAFAAGKADLSGMNGGKEPLFISEVVHRAFIDVNEEGTEAAAVTAVAPAAGEVIEPPPVFRADHPFLFLIHDTRTGCILFMGRVVNPTE